MSDSNQQMMVPAQQAAVATVGNGDLFDPNAFGHLMRLAKMFAASPLVPDHLRKGSQEQAIANCAIVLSMAHELGENPIVVANNIHTVNGKFGWSSSYMIARANRGGRLKTPINWRSEGTGDSLTVTAYATTVEGNQIESPPVSMKMAKAEGWTKNAKYGSMPEVMLRYRSAAFLVRMYLPESLLGYQTADELETMPAERVAQAGPAPKNILAAVLLPEPKQAEQPVESAARSAAAAALDHYLAAHDGVFPAWWPSDEQYRTLDDNALSALVDRLENEPDVTPGELGL